MRKTTDKKNILIITKDLFATNRRVCFIDVFTLEKSYFLELYLRFGQIIFYTILISIYLVN